MTCLLLPLSGHTPSSKHECPPIPIPGDPRVRVRASLCLQTCGRAQTPEKLGPRLSPKSPLFHSPGPQEARPRVLPGLGRGGPKRESGPSSPSVGERLEDAGGRRPGSGLRRAPATRPRWEGRSRARAMTNGPAAPPRRAAPSLRRRRRARGGAVFAATFALRAGPGEPGACAEARRCQAGLGAPLGEQGPNPTLSLPGLKRLSASLLLSPSPDTQRPPSRPWYGERRGPILAPLALRLPELPSAAKQREATGQPPAPACWAGHRWGPGGKGRGETGLTQPTSVAARSRRAAEASPRRGPAAPVRASARASRGRSAALPRLPALTLISAASLLQTQPATQAKPSPPPPPCSPAPA